MSELLLRQHRVLPRPRPDLLPHQLLARVNLLSRQAGTTPKSSHTNSSLAPGWPFTLKTLSCWSPPHATPLAPGQGFPFFVPLKVPTFQEGILLPFREWLRHRLLPGSPYPNPDPPSLSENAVFQSPSNHILILPRVHELSRFHEDWVRACPSSPEPT